MNGNPANLAVATVPPDEAPIAAGRGLLESTRAMLARDFDGRLAEGQSVLDRARYALTTPWDTAIADASGALQAARGSLDNTVNLVLGNAMFVAEQHGIPMPSLSEIRTRNSFPVPEALHSAPGFGPNPPILPEPQPPTGTGPTAGGPELTCLVHLLPEGVRPIYVWLVRQPGGSYAVAPANPSVISVELVLEHKFRFWWCAELACRLLTECGWSVDKTRRYYNVIEQVQLQSGNDPGFMGPFCQTAQATFDAYLTAIQQGNISGLPVGRPPGEMKPLSGIILPGQGVAPGQE